MKRAKTIMLAVLAVLVVALGAAAGLLGYRISGLRRYQEQLSLGEKYLAELDYENAEICFQKAIEINEKRVASYVRLSVVYVKQNTPIPRERSLWTGLNSRSRLWKRKRKSKILAAFRTQEVRIRRGKSPRRRASRRRNFLPLTFRIP